MATELKTPSDEIEYWGSWLSRKQAEKWAGSHSIHASREHQEKHRQRIARWKRSRIERGKFHAASPHQE